MKVAVYHNLTSGGSKREAYELTKRMVESGYDVDLHRPRTGNEEFLPLNQLVRREYVYEVEPSRSTAVRVPIISELVEFAAKKYDLKRMETASNQIARKIDDLNYDFVFVHHDRIVQSPYILKYLNTATVYYCAEPMRQFYEPAIPRPYVATGASTHCAVMRCRTFTENVINRQIELDDRSNIQFADVLLTNSYFSRESIYRAYGLNSYVSYLGVDAERFLPNDRIRDRYIVSVGAVSPYKGYDFIVRSLSCVEKRWRPKFLIIGNTVSRREASYLYDLADSRRVELSIRENVSESELILAYQSSIALVYAPVMEPFGLAPIEAMACGIPVLAVAEGGVRETVEHMKNGILTQRDEEEFGSAITRIVKDDVLRKSLGAYGRDIVVNKWTWSHAFKRFEDNLRKLVASGRAIT